jgi:hypothetical protein
MCEQSEELAKIKPFVFEDELIGHRIEVEVGLHFSILSIDDRCYYFEKETGKFDGTSVPMSEKSFEP